MRKFPTTMATQHPDNARSPYWDREGNPFVGVHKEVADCVSSFRDLGAGEYMWDWEGKHADAAVIDKLFTKYYDYFAKHRLGRDKFLTFRLPNIWEEKGYSLLQAMSVILASEDFARDLQFTDRPLFEVILPMTERADQLLYMHTHFQQLAAFKSTIFTPDQAANTPHLELIPLVESTDSQCGIGTLLDEYAAMHQQQLGTRPAYIRPFLARSDPALVSGMLATVLANKVALSASYAFADRTGIAVHPIAGVGSLPFRGGLAPDTVDEFVDEFPGLRTASIQSSFRFDYPLSQVKGAVAKLARLARTKPEQLSASDEAKLVEITRRSAKIYQPTLQAIARDVAPVFAAVPRRRERRQHTGLLGYGRQVSGTAMPRAITFTAGFYSLGVPPEFIGLGRTLRSLSSAELDLVRRHYRSLPADVLRAGRFLNSDNLSLLSRRNSAWKDVQTDIQATEEVLGLTVAPRTHNDKVHRNLTANVLLLKNNPTAVSAVIAETALLRNSLG